MNRFQRIRDFHADRLKGVGSSDLPILAGLTRRYENDYTLVKTGEVLTLPSTPLTLWRVKTGKVVPIDAPQYGDGRNPRKWGNYLEPLILMEYVIERYGPEIGQEFYRNATRTEPVATRELKVKTECWHPKYPFAYAHCDLVDLTRDPLIVEAKSAGMMSAKRREGISGLAGYDNDDRSQEGIPDTVSIQVQWQLLCYDIGEAIVKPLIDTSDLRTYGPIFPSSKVQSDALALAERFWWHVENDKEPQPVTWDDVVSLNPTLDDTTAIVGGDEELKVREMIAEAKRRKASIKANDLRIEDIKDALGIVAGRNKFIGSAGGDPLARLSDRRSESLTLGAEASAIRKAQEKKKPEPLTPLEKKILAMDAEAQDLGLVKVSEWREVRY